MWVSDIDTTIIGQDRDLQYPHLLPLNEKFVSISAGYTHSLALTGSLIKFR
jgi:hypothetical protein